LRSFLKRRVKFGSREDFGNPGDLCRIGTRPELRASPTFFGGLTFGKEQELLWRIARGGPQKKSISFFQTRPGVKDWGLLIFDEFLVGRGAEDQHISLDALRETLSAGAIFL